mmetsp:Transcript_8583/g.14492  ORF Transcript_8583/g.14492 Transcript_8583/m.14492 type:complete len:141 (+) Transcript_8583:900-1322(+)
MSKTKYLYTTDGSDKIMVIDEKQWRQVKTISVKFKNGAKLSNINELEILQKEVNQYASQELVELQLRRQKYIFANQFLKSDVHLINLETGVVQHTWDMSHLLSLQKDYAKQKGGFYDWGNDVLNGIAYNFKNDNFILTGK